MTSWMSQTGPDNLYLLVIGNTDTSDNSYKYTALIATIVKMRFNVSMV